MTNDVQSVQSSPVASRLFYMQTGNQTDCTYQDLLGFTRFLNIALV